jgi:protein-disulfide isomerase
VNSILRCGSRWSQLLLRNDGYQVFSIRLKGYELFEREGSRDAPGPGATAVNDEAGASALNEAADRVVEKKGGVVRILDHLVTSCVAITLICATTLTLNTWIQRRSATGRSAGAVSKALSVRDLPLGGAAVIGSPSAKVAIIQYSDFECPFCGEFARKTWPRIKDAYIDSGKVLGVFRHLPLSIHRYARTAAISADCARLQGRFWEMHDLLFGDADHIADLVGSVAPTGLSVDRVKYATCVQGHDGQSIDDDIALAFDLGITGTPTLIIGTRKRNGTVRASQVLTGAQSFSEVSAVLERVLR